MDGPTKFHCPWNLQSLFNCLFGTHNSFLIAISETENSPPREQMELIFNGALVCDTPRSQEPRFAHPEALSAAWILLFNPSQSPFGLRGRPKVNPPDHSVTLPKKQAIVPHRHCDRQNRRGRPPFRHNLQTRHSQQQKAMIPKPIPTHAPPPANSNLPHALTSPDNSTRFTNCVSTPWTAITAVFRPGNSFPLRIATKPPANSNTRLTGSSPTARNSPTARLLCNSESAQ